MKLTEKQIADELRAMRPLPEPAFAAELDASSATARSHESPLRAWMSRLATVPPRRWVPVGAAIVSFAAVGAVAISQISSDPAPQTSSPSIVAEDQREPTAPESAGAGAEAAPQSTIAPSPPIAPPDRNLAPNAAKREVERTVSMTLSTERSEVPEVADGVVEVTDRYKGFVVSSNVSEGAEVARASFDLRIPTARLQEAVADLSGLAHVKSRNEGSLDITAPTVSARERTADAKAEIDGLLEQLAAAGSTTESEAIRAQLRSARAELAAARNELQSLEQRAQLTAVSLTVTGDGDGGPWTIGDAADDALDVLRAVAGAALITLAVLVPLALIGFLFWLANRALVRRGRESALDD